MERKSRDQILEQLESVDMLRNFIEWLRLISCLSLLAWDVIRFAFIIIIGLSDSIEE